MTRRTQRQQRPFALERLEDRRMKAGDIPTTNGMMTLSDDGTLTVTGTNSADHITFSIKYLP